MYPELDALDTHILQFLQHDARLTNKEIADKLGKSVTSVHERIKKLEAADVIKRYAAILNNDLIGKSLIAFTTVHLTAHAETALNGFAREIVKFPEVLECYHLSGAFDFLLKIALKDMSAYNTFLMKKLATLPNIGEVQSYFVLSEQKVDTAYKLELPVPSTKPIRKNSQKNNLS